MKKKIKIKRVYEKVSREDGIRILVDRIWPRGVKKEDLKPDYWIKEIAPSAELRKWFSHKPDKWEEFKKKYFSELKEKKSVCKDLLDKGGNITLLYSARNEKYNQAAALIEFLKKEIL